MLLIAHCGYYLECACVVAAGDVTDSAKKKSHQAITIALAPRRGNVKPDVCSPPPTKKGNKCCCTCIPST